jgi:hypothetical protein
VGDTSGQLVSAPVGGALLAAYACVFALAGAHALAHRDVT